MLDTYARMKWVGESERLIAGFPSVLLAFCVYTNLPFVVVVVGMAPNSAQQEDQDLRRVFTNSGGRP